MYNVFYTQKWVQKLKKKMSYELSRLYFLYETGTYT